MNEELTGYELSKNWFDFCFENPDLITPTHTAVYFFCIEHCNRLGWKNKFGLPTQMAMDAIGVKNWRTYIKAFNDIVDWGFIQVVQKSKNQYSANVIAIVKNTKALAKANTGANTKALSKAIQKHSQKQGNSIADIDKPLNQITIKPINNKDFDLNFIEEKLKNIFLEFIDYRKKVKKPFKTQRGLESAYKELIALSSGDFEIASTIIKQSIDNEWQGLFPLKEKKGNQSRTGQSLPPANEDEKNKLLAKIGG